jgi:thermitase
MKWLKLILLGIFGLGLLVSSVGVTPYVLASNEPVEFLVKFKTVLPQAAVEQFSTQLGGHRRIEIDRIGVQVLTFPSPANPQTILARLKANPQVAYAELNGTATASYIPTDPGYPNQWGLDKIKAPQGWDIQPGNASVVIGIIDTGADLNHPDLAGKLIPGWNYDAFSPGYNTADTTDNNGHGTHVAGITAALTNNALGVAGACPNCVFMPVKVLGADGNGTYDAVASGIIYTADHGARIINLSLGGTAFSQTLQDAVNYAYNAGALVVAAAGNDGTNVITYPAAFTNTLAVAATDSADQRATFSNYNTYISVAAPGVDIYSSYWSSAGGSTYAYLNGTSMATPFVSGLAGLLLSQDSSRTNATLRAIIQNTADDINVSGWDPYTGYGRINVARALSGSISGTVTDATTGATLVNAQVQALQGGQVKIMTFTAANGSYHLLYLPAGTYDIKTSLSGYTSQTQPSIVVVAGQDTANINFALTRVGAIAGQVTNGRKALAGATVQALQGTQVIGSATTDAAGNYQINGLPVGTYSVKAVATGYQSQTQAGVLVNPGQTTSGVNFSLKK